MTSRIDSFPEEMELLVQQVRNKIPEAHLWMAVIDQAIEDLSHPSLRQAAVQWFSSAARGPGSFHWACNHLDLNASAVWTSLNKSRALDKNIGSSFFQHR
jgi:hypothetical protein